jgi:hypothetical protein
MAFAETGSPTKGKTKKAESWYQTSKTGNAAYIKPTKENKETSTIKVSNTVTYKNYTYKVTSIKSEAFKGSKAKVIIIGAKNCTKVSKSAFKGSKVKKSKIVVKVTKKMSKKNFAKLKKALINAGIKAKNIKTGSKKPQQQAVEEEDLT